MKNRHIAKIVKETATLVNDGYLIVRAQSNQNWNIRFNNGKIEKVTVDNNNGMGVQAFTKNGASGFASEDIISREAGAELATRAFDLASQNERYHGECNKKIFETPFVNEDTILDDDCFENTTPNELIKNIAEIHNRLLEGTIPSNGKVSWQTNYFQVEDKWWIGRSDGSFVSYRVPRSVLIHVGTVKTGDCAQSMQVHRSGTGADLLDSELKDKLLHKKACDRAEFAARVSLAGTVAGGSYPLVIDYGLAKGLAHEAFGHAVESDLLHQSVLGEKGSLREGLKIASEVVDIIDGPIIKDWAYQPFSANGVPRKDTLIVQNGILKKELGDIFTGNHKEGIVSDAGRAEYYGAIPLPRMTNIRLLIKNKFSLKHNKDLFEDIKSLRATMQEYNLLEKDYHLLLLGYRGGQVNTKTGDFVFQCDGIVNLADPDLTVYKPSIFSGKILSALNAVRAGVGDEEYDAIGTCGKGGQSVPSSGGSSRYVLLNRDDQVRLGGDDKNGK